MPTRPPPPRPPAAEVNTRRMVAIGTALYLLAFLVLLPWYRWLGQHHHRVWLWTCLAGWVLGLVGLSIMTRHHRSGRAP